jgi:hypothetical protein
MQQELIQWMSIVVTHMRFLSFFVSLVFDPIVVPYFACSVPYCDDPCADSDGLPVDAICAGSWGQGCTKCK